MEDIHVIDWFVFLSLYTKHECGISKAMSEEDGRGEGWIVMYLAMFGSEKHEQSDQPGLHNVFLWSKILTSLCWHWIVQSIIISSDKSVYILNKWS